MFLLDDLVTTCLDNHAKNDLPCNKKSVMALIYCILQSSLLSTIHVKCNANCSADDIFEF